MSSSVSVKLLFIQIFFLVLLAVATSFRIGEQKPTTAQTTETILRQTAQKRLDSDVQINKNKALSPNQSEDTSDDNGLVEVKESEIPEGAMVYVLEEPLDQPVDGEILKTANNIVFRPLFRYRSKQEAQRRNSNRFRRRYFIPRRSYRHVYRYPYYYPSYYY